MVVQRCSTTLTARSEARLNVKQFRYFNSRRSRQLACTGARTVRQDQKWVQAASWVRGQKPCRGYRTSPFCQNCLTLRHTSLLRFFYLAIVKPLVHRDDDLGGEVGFRKMLGRLAHCLPSFGIGDEFSHLFGQSPDVSWRNQ